jgi:hypothetical protein
MPVKPLPSNPNLNHLKHQATDLLREHALRKPEVAQRIREFHPRWSQASDAEIFAAKLKLSDAQLAIAREAGFPSWTRLKRHIEKPTPADRLDLPHHERIEDPVFRRAVELLDAGDVGGLRAHLRAHPGLERQRVVFEGGNYFRNPCLLEFIAENPIRRGKLPKNIVRVAEAILESGVEQGALDDALGLVVTGRVPRECDVQLALIDLLCERGADPNGAALAAALQGELGAMEHLIRRGAPITLPLAAALGRTEDARLLLPAADSRERQLALALGAQLGRAGMVRLLLDAGEDPSRYNPIGAHSHSTPLHQAALAGHREVVKLLVEHGAKLDMRDTIWNATPAEWARHEKRSEIEAYLREQERAAKAERRSPRT